MARRLRVLLLTACLSALAHGRELRQTVTATASSSSGLVVPTTTVINMQTGTATAQALPSTTAPSLLSSIKWPVFPTTALPAPAITTAAASPAQPTTSSAAAPTAALTGGSCPVCCCCACQADRAAHWSTPANRFCCILQRCLTHTFELPHPDFPQDPQKALDLHNQARAARGAPALSWSPSLASSAQAYANRCVFQHSGTAGVGENLYLNSASATCSDAVTMWVAEAPYYSGAYSSATGHWTQIVWKSTTAVGCGLARCSIGTLVVCQYSPQGNILSQFPANV